VDKQTVGMLVAEEGSERSETGRGQVCRFREDACQRCHQSLAGVMHLSVMVGWTAPPDVVKHTVDSARTLVERSVVFGEMTSH